MPRFTILPTPTRTKSADIFQAVVSNVMCPLRIKQLEWGGMWIEIAKLAVPVGIAVLGYLAKYLNDLRLAQRKDHLERIDRQLRELYGPLLSLASAAHMAYWEGFRKLHRPDMPMWDPPQDDPTKLPTAEEVTAFHLWSRAVFMPLNRQMVDCVIQHADLLEEETMPDCLLSLLAHVAAYEGIIKEWDAGNERHHTPRIRFPDGIREYAARHFIELKREQVRLHGAN